jgi:hypothetical protein
LLPVRPDPLGRQPSSFGAFGVGEFFLRIGRAGVAYREEAR